MPVKRSAYKELRKGKRKHARNISIKTELKTLAKKFEKLITADKPDDAIKVLNLLVSKFDKASSKGIVKANTAKRKISRFMKRLSKKAKK